jgi:ABC-type amino acid transport substrate-binding protein
VLDRGHLIVGTGSTNAPWHFEDEGGKLVGMDITMARILAQGLLDDPRRSSSCRGTRRRASPTSPPARSTSSSSS